MIMRVNLRVNLRMTLEMTEMGIMRLNLRATSWKIKIAERNIELGHHLHLLPHHCHHVLD